MKTKINWQHILPVNDWIEHKDIGFDCICNPTIDLDYMLVIHNAIDNREEREKNEKEK